MHIPIPHWLARGYDVFEAWANVAVWRRGDIRRIDIVVAMLGIFAASYYGWRNGWQSAAFGFVAYAAMVSVGLLMRK